jgi:hypothetical protein
MKTKILLWGGVLILVAGIAAAAVWWILRPQTITFSSGAKLTLMAVEYGKHHAPPANKTTATRGRGRGGAFTTTNDTLVVWVRQEYDSKEWHNFQYFAYDEAGAACVGNSGMTYGNGGRQGNQVVGLRLDAFPRRQSKFFLRVQENSNGGQEVSDQKFVIRNPARGAFPTWYPDSLPNTQEDDDVSVTLTKLVLGANLPYTRNSDDPDDAMNKGVQATFHAERNGKPVTNWQPVSIETSDATGNRIHGFVTGNDWNGNDDVATYQWGLWPDEPVWKVRFEFSQQSDFSPAELWTVQNIPLQPGRQQDFWNYNTRRNNTNSAFAEADLEGVHLEIFPAKQFTDAPPNSQQQGGLMIQANSALPDGMRLTLVKLTDDQTNDVGYWDSGSGRNNNVTFYRYQLRDLGGVTNLNLTVALHKSRFVEFAAKPEKAAAAAAAQ